MIRTKYEVKSINGEASVEKDAEFEEDITHKFYTQNDIYKFFSRYKFTEFIDEFRDEYNSQVRCHAKYYLSILNGRRCLYFGRFLVSTLDINDRNEPSFLAVPSFGDNGNPVQEINNILQNELYTQVKVCVAMDIKFLLFCSLDTVYNQDRDPEVEAYEQEQLEGLEDRGSDYDNDYDSTEEEMFTPLVETPFVTDKCCICLTEKPDVILVPCLHKSVCLQCEEKGNLTKCPTCRLMIIRKIKI